MISFKPTEEQELVRDAMHEFAEQAIRPIARECDEASQVPESFLEADPWRSASSRLQIPEAYGGAGELRSPITNAIVARGARAGATPRSRLPRSRPPRSRTR